MTMANSAVSSTPRSGVSLRKTNKPLMEKRRRARINDSLTQLKSLVIHSSKKDSSQFSKLEKADILELTVKHLRGLQQQQQQQQVNPTDISANNGQKYRAGFVECANEVIRYLDQSQSFNNDTKAKVISHLAQCLQLVSHVQPKPVPVSAQAAPGATILNAPPTAATTTQLPNGQIIQIVSNPAIQNIQPATAAASGILGFKQPVSSMQGFNMTSSTSSTASATGGVVTHSNPNPAQTAYVRYTQPLHIQIPPLVSPVLIQQTQPAKMATVAKETVHNTSSCSSSSTENVSQDLVSSSTNSVASPLPASNSSSSPASLHASLPKVRAQKQLNFYSSDEMNMDILARSRTYSMASSSSSLSSSETEMTSPLNLSQSPPYPSQKFESSRHPNAHHRSLSSSSTSSNSSSSSSISHSSILPEHYQVSQPIPIKAHDKSSVSIHPHHHLNGQSFHQERNTGLNLNTTSVIVNSRKYTAAEFPESKYFSMMEGHDDRHCINHHSTPSPASSMGEERLWRPW